VNSRFKWEEDVLGEWTKQEAEDAETEKKLAGEKMEKIAKKEAEVEKKNEMDLTTVKNRNAKLQLEKDRTLGAVRSGSMNSTHGSTASNIDTVAHEDTTHHSNHDTTTKGKVATPSQLRKRAPMSTFKRQGA